MFVEFTIDAKGVKEIFNTFHIARVKNMGSEGTMLYVIDYGQCLVKESYELVRQAVFG